jgi:hypothetical protein
MYSEKENVIAFTAPETAGRPTSSSRSAIGDPEVFVEQMPAELLAQVAIEAFNRFASRRGKRRFKNVNIRDAQLAAFCLLRLVRSGSV